MKKSDKDAIELHWKIASLKSKIDFIDRNFGMWLNNNYKITFEFKQKYYNETIK